MPYRGGPPAPSVCWSDFASELDGQVSQTLSQLCVPTQLASSSNAGPEGAAGPLRRPNPARTAASAAFHPGTRHTTHIIMCSSQEGIIPVYSLAAGELNI